MKRLLPLALLALAACDPMIWSDAPLFTASGGQPRPGLWAVLEDGCTSPATAAVEDWPPCAAPVWIRDDRLTVMMMNPARSQYVLAEGAPAVLQLSEPEGGDPAEGERPSYTYVAVAPDGPAPYTRGRVWTSTPCPPDAAAVAGIQGDEDDCRARTADAVRAVLKAATAAEPGRRIVWVAP